MEKDPYNNIIVIGNNGIIYPCIIGGYDVDSYLLYVKEVNPKQFLVCFPIEELVQDLYTNRPFLKKNFTLVNNVLVITQLFVGIFFLDIDSLSLKNVDVIEFDIF